MSDDLVGEQVQEPKAAAVPKSGEPISENRQAALQGYLDRWQESMNYGERKGPFDKIPLTSANSSWPAKQSGRDLIWQRAQEQEAHTLD